VILWLILKCVEWAGAVVPDMTSIARAVYIAAVFATVSGAAVFAIASFATVAVAAVVPGVVIITDEIAAAVAEPACAATLAQRALGVETVPSLIWFAAAIADQTLAAIVALVAVHTPVDFTVGVFASAWEAVKCFRH